VESLSLIGLLSVRVSPSRLSPGPRYPTGQRPTALVGEAMAAWREADRRKGVLRPNQPLVAEACDVGNPESRIARTRQLRTPTLGLLCAPRPGAHPRSQPNMTARTACRSGSFSGCWAVVVDDPIRW